MNRKRMAWAHNLLAEVAVLDDRPEDARREFGNALEILEPYRCPIIEWRIFWQAAGVARLFHDRKAEDDFLGRARAVVGNLASSVRDETARQSSCEPSRFVNY